MVTVELKNLCFLFRKANEGLLALSQEETMPISIRQLAYGTDIICQYDIVDVVTDTFSYHEKIAHFM